MILIGNIILDVLMVMSYTDLNYIPQSKYYNCLLLLQI